MARIPRGIVGDIPYHILNRANGRQTIFKKDKDYEAFLKIIKEDINHSLSKKTTISFRSAAISKEIP